MSRVFTTLRTKYHAYRAKLSDLLSIRDKCRKEPLTTDELILLIQKYPEFRPSQKDFEIRTLMNLTHQMKAQTVVEIGGYKGGSLFLLAQSSAVPSTIISIDIAYTLLQRLAYKLFAKPGQRIKCIAGDSKKQVRRVQRALAGRKIDLLFIDGDHSFLGVVSDYALYSPLVKPGGVIAFHDIHPDYRMRYGKHTGSYVGEVPLFWKALASTGVTTEEYIENKDQDGYGLGVVFIQDEDHKPT